MIKFRWKYTEKILQVLYMLMQKKQEELPEKLTSYSIVDKNQ